MKCDEWQSEGVVSSSDAGRGSDLAADNQLGTAEKLSQNDPLKPGKSATAPRGSGRGVAKIKWHIPIPKQQLKFKMAAGISATTIPTKVQDDTITTVSKAVASSVTLEQESMPPTAAADSGSNAPQLTADITSCDIPSGVKPMVTKGKILQKVKSFVVFISIESIMIIITLCYCVLIISRA